MFAAGSIKSSKWGWSVKKYPTKYGDTSTQDSNAGYFTGGCLAPNGLIYCLPTYIGAQFVTVIKPGKSNSKTSKWEPATITNVPASNTTNSKTPLLTDITTTQSALQRRFANKGILAPNGLIYFFGFLAESYIVVKPQENPNLDIAQFTEWKVVTYASVGLAPVSGSSGYGGGFLHTDGKIYLLPQFYGNSGSSSPIARIIPRSDYLSNDTIEKSAYWTPLSNSTNDVRRYFPLGSQSATGCFKRPININGTEIAIPPDTYAPVYASTNSFLGPYPAIGDAISHPNGNIYVFGGGRNAYILKVKTDSTVWNTNANPAGAIFYTSDTLRVPNKLPSGYSGSLGIQGSFMSGSIEKLRPGQDPTTAKIYLHYAGTWLNDTSITSTGYFQNNYTRTIVFDPVTETFENGGEQITTIATNQQPFNLKPGIRMANGHIFCITNRLTGNFGGNQNPYGQLIVSGSTINEENKMIGPNTSRSILSENQISVINNICYGNIDPVCNQGSHALTGSSLGKTFVTAPTAAYEITSVKGFYPGIRYFNYNDSLNASFTSAKNTINNVMYPSSNQVKLFGVDLTGVLSSGKPFYLVSPSLGIMEPFTISGVSLSGSDTIVTVSGTPFYPNYQTYVQGVDFISATQLNVSMTNAEFNSGQSWSSKKIFIESSLNSGLFTTTSSGYFYNAGTETLTLTFPAGTFGDTGNDTNALLYYADPVVDEGSTFTYGQLVEFPDDETLRIWGVDLSNSMNDVAYVNVSGSSIIGNNGAKLRYDNGSTSPVYSGQYTDIIFSPSTFTNSDVDANVTMSFQYALNDADIYEIPSDLTELPTSLYNAYHNKPR